MSTCPNGNRRFPGRSDQRDHARIRRRSQDELPGRAHHLPSVGLGGQQSGGSFGFRTDQATRPSGAFIREQGVAARRLVVQFAWLYAAPSARSSPQPEQEEGPIHARDDSCTRSATTWPRVLAAQVARSSRQTIAAIVSWLDRSRR
jgi:hypothetical protein